MKVLLKNVKGSDDDSFASGSRLNKSSLRRGSTIRKRQPKNIRWILLTPKSTDDETKDFTTTQIRQFIRWLFFF